MATLVMRPNAIGSNGDGWNLVAGATKVAATDPGSPPGNDGDASYINNSGDTSQQSFIPDYNFPETMAAVASVTVKAIAKDILGSGAIKIRLYDNGASGTQDTAALSPGGSYAEVSQTFTTDSDGNSWTEAKLRDTALEWSVYLDNATDWINVTSLWIEVDYTPSAVTEEFPKEGMSQLLRISRKPIGEVTIDLPPDAVGMIPVEPFQLSHPDGLSTSTTGWGRNNPNRKLLHVKSVSLNLNTLKTTVKAFDFRRYHTTFWETCKSPYTIQSDAYTQDGPARLDRGNTRSFGRNTQAYAPEVGGLYVKFTNNVQRMTTDGYFQEDQNKNYVRNPSFRHSNGFFTHWTRGSTFVTPLTQATCSKVTLFDNNISSGALAIGPIVVASSGNNYFYAGANAQAYEGDKEAVFSCYYHKPSTDSGISVVIRREDSTKGNVRYWFPAEERWSTSYVQTPLSVTTTLSVTSIPMGTPATTWYAANNPTWLIIFNAAQRITTELFYMAHCQVEAHGDASGTIRRGRAYSSPISATTEKKPIRDQDVWMIKADLTRKVANPKRGTMFMDWIPYFSTTHMTGISSGSQRRDVNAGLMHLVFNTSNAMKAWYERNSTTADDNRIHFYYGGKSATYSTSFTRLQKLRMAFRWSSTHAELGESNKLSVFCAVGTLTAGSSSYTFGDMVKGTDNTTAYETAADVATTTRQLWIGTDNGQTAAISHGSANGKIANVEFVPYVLSDKEIIEWNT